MTEKKIRGWFYWPVVIIATIILLPFICGYIMLWLSIKPFTFILEIFRQLISKYNLFLIRHSDEAKEIKNTEARRILGFKDDEVSN